MKITQIIPIQEYGNIQIECDNKEEYIQALKDIREVFKTNIEDIVKITTMEKKLLKLRQEEINKFLTKK